MSALIVPKRNEPKILTEAKEFVVHDIAPTLLPNERGYFQVKLIGLYRNHAQLGIRLVEAKNKNNVTRDFGSNVVPVYGGVISKFRESELILVEGQPPIDATFQARLLGVNEQQTEAEIELRTIDENRIETFSFGSKTIAVGKTITLEGVDVIVYTDKKGMH